MEYTSQVNLNLEKPIFRSRVGIAWCIDACMYLFVRVYTYACASVCGSLGSHARSGWKCSLDWPGTSGVREGIYFLEADNHHPVQCVRSCSRRFAPLLMLMLMADGKCCSR
jgi:hypothetical protein